MTFKDPWVLFLIVPVFIIVYLFKRLNRQPTFLFPTKNLLAGVGVSWKNRFYLLPEILRYIVIVLFIVALSGPRLVKKETLHKTEGIDIVLAIDASESMLAEDFIIDNKRINRLEIVKTVVKEFIKNRSNDRIGLVAFGSVAYTVCPLTTDYAWLSLNLDLIQVGVIEPRTAIGSAISSSVLRLKSSQAKSKIIILLTDGENTAGEIDPLKAAQIAKNKEIKIYTIGAGSTGFAPVPMMDFLGRKVYQQQATSIDEKTLTKIADITNGKYFRATDTESLRKVYDEIDKLEKTQIEEVGYLEFEELFDEVLLLALIFLVLELILRNTILMRIP